MFPYYYAELQASLWPFWEDVPARGTALMDPLRTLHISLYSMRPGIAKAPESYAALKHMTIFGS